MAYREFIIACVARIPTRDRDSIFFDSSVQNEITYTLSGYLTEIAALRPGGSGFSPAPGWYFKAADFGALRRAARAASAIHPKRSSVQRRTNACIPRAGA